jgi:hypothetical protein
MTVTALDAEYWLAQTLVGGGLLLLLARVLMTWTAQPARRQRLGEWAVVAALLLPLLSVAPAWLVVPVPVEEPVPTILDTPVAAGTDDPKEADAPSRAGKGLPEFRTGLVPAPEAAEPPVVRPESTTQPPSLAAPGPVPPAGSANAESFHLPSLDELVGWSLVAYAAGASLLLGHWLLGHLALWTLLRRAVPAPSWLAGLLAEITEGRSAPRLFVSGQVRVPFSCGLLRPTIVLPARLCETGSPAALRWVLAHEWTHLERHDARAGLLFGLGRVLYFPLPWFWELRRQVQLCQEYVADAAAAALGRSEDYAQFLLTWAAAPAPPAGAPGVFGHNSDLFRRVTMLLQDSRPVERRCPRRWSFSMAAGLLALAGLVAGIHLQAGATQVPKEEPKKDQTKKEEPKKDGHVPIKPDSVVPDFGDPFKDGKGLGAEEFKELRQQMEQMQKEWRKAMEQWRTGRPGMAWTLGHNVSGRLGVQVRPPSEALSDQLDLPRGQGLVIETVQADSAAAKAGVKPHDILLELNGKPVPDNASEFVKQLNDIKANTPVDAMVLRKGKKETVKGLTLPEAKAAEPGGNAFDFGFPTLPRGFNFQPFPDGAFAGPGDKGGMTSTIHENDRFTSRLQDGGLAITVTGKVEDGKTKVSEIQIKDGNKTEKYESLDKVPEQYRDKVKHLIEVSSKPRLDLND